MDRMQTSNKEQKYLSIAAKLEGMTFLFFYIPSSFSFTIFDTIGNSICQIFF